MGKVKLVGLSGSAHEIGYQHGHQLQERVEKTWQFYSSVLFANRLDLLEDLGNSYLKVIEDFSCDRIAEIRGIAEGAEMDVWKIAVLNARTEIFHLLTGGQGVNECTAAYARSARVLGQNWDWMEQLEPLITVLEITREDGHQILQMTEPGIIGKIGLNSAGLGVCLNILTGGESQVAVPVHLLLRELLECDSLDQFRTRLESMPTFGTYSHILAADATGNFLSVEFCGSHIEFVDYDSAPVIHTNHYLSDFANGRDNDNDPLYENSVNRFRRAAGILSETAIEDVEDMMTLLADRSDQVAEICARYHKKLGLMIGTVSSVIMDLPKREIHISIGNPVDNRYHRFAAQRNC